MTLNLTDYWLNQGNTSGNKAKKPFKVKKYILILPSTLTLIPLCSIGESFFLSPANPEKPLQKTENIVTIE